MSIKDVMLLSMLSDSPSVEYYSTSKKYESIEYVKKSIKYFVVGAAIGLFFAWILTLNGTTIDPIISIEMTRVIIVLMYGYIGFSLHAGLSLIDSNVSFPMLLVLLFTGILVLVFAFAIGIGAIIAIPRFIIKLRAVYK